MGMAGGKLTIKVNRRAHMASGSTIVRFCLCEDYAPESLEFRVPPLFCPTCQLWPAIRQLAQASRP